MPIEELKVDLTPRMRKSEIYARRSILSRTLVGSWATTFKGHGIEFAGYRAYQYGDDASMIDWRASLRSSQTLVREFEEYKSFSVFVLVDVSNSMLFTSEEKLKAEYAAELGYSIAEGVLRGGDAVGLSLFSSRLIDPVYPNIGSGMLERISKPLLESKNYGGNKDIKKVLNETRYFLKSNAVLILISDFIGMTPGWERYIQMMSRNFEIIGIMLRDPRDRFLPKGAGQYAIEDPFSDDYMYIDVNHFAQEYKDLVLKEEHKIQRVFEHVKGGFAIVQTDQDFNGPLETLFRKRQFVTGTII